MSDIETRTRAGMSTRQWLALAIVVPVVLIGAFAASRALDSDPGSDRVGLQIDPVEQASDVDWFYRIPPGTADRISRGELVEIVPAELTVTVGDTIRIVNNDSSAHVVGVFFVGAGETVTQRFQSAGVLEDVCTVHSSGSFRLSVVEA